VTTLTKKKKNPQGPKPLVWRGYRNCDVCTRWRPVSDFTVYQTRTGYEQIKGTCDACKRQVERDRYNRLTPEQRRAKGVKANKQAAKRRNKALEYIERQAKILDRQNEKIDKLEKKVEAGRAQLRKRHRHMENRKDEYVDIVPFRMWLLRANRESDYNTVELAARIGQDEAKVRRWLDGFQWNGAGRDPDPINSIKLSTVDSIGVAWGDGGLVQRLYPLEGED
jgi:predicted RNase H-like nuclease (RuvC/YqgF family)